MHMCMGSVFHHCYVIMPIYTKSHLCLFMLSSLQRFIFVYTLIYAVSAHLISSILHWFIVTYISFWFGFSMAYTNPPWYGHSDLYQLDSFLFGFDSYWYAHDCDSAIVHLFPIWCISMPVMLSDGFLINKYSFFDICYDWINLSWPMI